VFRINRYSDYTSKINKDFLHLDLIKCLVYKGFQFIKGLFDLVQISLYLEKKRLMTNYPENTLSDLEGGPFSNKTTSYNKELRHFKNSLKPLVTVTSKKGDSSGLKFFFIWLVTS